MYHSLFLFYCIYMFVQQRQHDHLSVIDTFSYCLFLLLAHLYVREFNIKFLFYSIVHNRFFIHNREVTKNNFMYSIIVRGNLNLISWKIYNIISRLSLLSPIKDFGNMLKKRSIIPDKKWIVLSNTWNIVWLLYSLHAICSLQVLSRC